MTRKGLAGSNPVLSGLSKKKRVTSKKFRARGYLIMSSNPLYSLQNYMEEQKKSITRNTLFEFKYDSFRKHRRGPMWYVMAVIVCALFIVYALATANFLFAVLIILFGFIIFVHDMRDPTEHDCHITDGGIIMDGRFMPYSEFTGFWIVYEPPYLKNLYLTRESVINAHLTIPLGETDPIELRRWLRRVILEDLERDDEPFTEMLGRVLKI